MAMSMDAIVLSGGGARAAYQVGVLKGLHELQPSYRPSILSGFSAGAINAGFLASHFHEPSFGLKSLEHLWSELRSEQVFRTDAFNFILNGVRLIWDLSFGGLHQQTSIRSLLDTAPLNELLSSLISKEQIEENLKSKLYEALTVSATDYGDGESVSFIQSQKSVTGFRRKRRRAELARICHSHIMASAALPLLFPAVEVEDKYYGDGCLRNIAPLSTAIHLGADRLIVIGVRRQVEASDRVLLRQKPGLGRILSVVLNAILLDTTDVDVERIERTNQLVELAGEDRASELGLKKIDLLWLTPSQDIGGLAKDHIQSLPFTLRYLLRGTGSKAEFSEIASYLLFEPSFLNKLIELGYRDVLSRRAEVTAFLEKINAAKTV